MQQAARMTPMPGGRISAIDYAAIGDQTRHYGPHSPPEQQQRANTSNPNATNVGANHDGSASEDDGADGSESDGAEADDEDASLEDPDVIAPSERVFGLEKAQTGLYPTTSHETAPESRDAVASLDAIKLETSLEKAITSDEDDYDGVDLISESGEEGPVVHNLEDRAILGSEEDDADGVRPSSPPNSPTGALSIASAELGQVDFSLDPFLTDDIFFEEQINLLDPNRCVKDSGFFGSINEFTITPPVAEAPRRRVRFADPPILPSETNRQLLEDSGQADASSTRLCGEISSKEEADFVRSNRNSREGRFMTGDEAIRLGARVGHGFAFESLESMDDGIDDDYAEDSIGSSSGYETDQGETTDEEDVPASATTHPSAVLRDSSASALNDRLAGQPLHQTQNSKLAPGQRLGPTLGSWITNPTKSIAVVASSGKHLIIRPPKRPATMDSKVFPNIVSSGQSSVQASPRPSIAKMVPPSYLTATDDSERERSEMSSQEMAIKMLNASPNVMLSGFGLGNGSLLSGHAMGPPEAFFPFQSIGADGRMILDGLDVEYDNDDDDDDDDEYCEDLLNIEDFIDFGKDSDDSDREADSTAGSCQSPAMSSPTQTAAKIASVASSPSQSSFLEHLDKGVVTAFRRNQHGFDTNSLGHSNKSPFRVANALKANSFMAPNTPFGSSKKRKLGGNLGAPIRQKHAPKKRRMLSRS